MHCLSKIRLKNLEFNISHACSYWESQLDCYSIQPPAFQVYIKQDFHRVLVKYILRMPKIFILIKNSSEAMKERIGIVF